jgi:hypothetical protein
MKLSTGEAGVPMTKTGKMPAANEWSPVFVQYFNGYPPRTLLAS